MLNNIKPDIIFTLSIDSRYAALIEQSAVMYLLNSVKNSECEIDIHPWCNPPYSGITEEQPHVNNLPVEQVDQKPGALIYYLKSNANILFCPLFSEASVIVQSRQP